MPRIVYTLLIFVGLLALEMAFVALVTGHLFVQFKSPLIEHFAFFLALAKDAPLTTLKLILVEQPFFIIQSQQKATGVTVWALHYFSFTVLLHLLVAFWLSAGLHRQGLSIHFGRITFIGSVLLLLSSLYLRLAGCCTGGPNWIVQTWLLSLVFNPITASTAMIRLYEFLKDGFVVLQLCSALAGGYLLLHGRKQPA